MYNKAPDFFSSFIGGREYFTGAYKVKRQNDF